MIDYSKMSDFEINKCVAKIYGGFALTLAVHNEPPSGKSFDPGRFDPCNNPADAWPIIAEKEISIEHVIIKWRASSLVYDKKYESGFFIFRSESDVGDISSRGALRAAMIVFLMMQEDKK